MHAFVAWLVFGCAPAPDSDKTDELLADVGAHEARIAALEAELAALSIPADPVPRLDAIEAEVAALEEEYSDLDSRLGDLEVTTADQATVEALTDRMEAVEAGNWRVGATFVTQDWQGHITDQLPATTGFAPTDMSSSGFETTFAMDPGSATARMVCASGTSTTFDCGEDAPHLGIAFTVPAAGEYRVCLSTQGISGGATISTLFQLVETELTSPTILASGSHRAILRVENLGSTQSVTTPFTLCEVFPWQAGEKAVRLFYHRPAASGVILLSDSARWDVTRVTW